MLNPVTQDTSTFAVRRYAPTSRFTGREDKKELRRMMDGKQWSVYDV